MHRLQTYLIHISASTARKRLTCRAQLCGSLRASMCPKVLGIASGLSGTKSRCCCLPALRTWTRVSVCRKRSGCALTDSFVLWNLLAGRAVMGRLLPLIAPDSPPKSCPSQRLTWKQTVARQHAWFHRIPASDDAGRSMTIPGLYGSDSFSR